MGAALLAVACPGPASAACTLVWGPKYQCLLHGELAKEGLAVDSQKRAFSVGFSEFQSGPMKDALLMVRDGGGTLLSQTLWSVTAFNNYAAGLWITPSGSAAITAGTAVTGNAVNPANMVVTRWLPGTGGAWTAPVQAGVAVLTPAALGLLGTEAWGCRVIEASATDIFVSGCTEFEIFVARLRKNTLALVTGWGANGVQSIASLSPGGCPTHEMPGAFVDFLNHRQSFVELVGNRLYLGGTLLNDLTGVAADYDFVVGCYSRATGAPLAPFGVQWSFGPGDEYMKAMAATSTGLYAVGAMGPWASPQMQLIAWRTDGVIRAPGIVTLPAPSRGNDVEAVVSGPRCEVYVGGYGRAGGFNGATWHYRHGLLPGAPIHLTPQWSGAWLGGPNPKPYGPAADVTDEVFDLGLGTGTHAGHVFAAGQALLSPGQHGQPLQCIAPNGAVSFSNNPATLAPLDDRAVAVVYSSAGSDAVFTHGTAADTLAGFWGCTAHWVSRHHRYQP